MDELIRMALTLESKVAELECQLQESQLQEVTTTGQLQEALEKLAERNGLQVPEGWQLVPKELTDEMLEVALEADEFEDFETIYAGVLAAAPQPEVNP